MWATEVDPSAIAKITDAGRRRVEARWIARHIKGQIASGATVRDPKSGQPRPAEAGDVAILFRSLGDASVYEAALAAEGLDYHVVGGSAYYAQQEVHDLINVLTAVEDPFDAVSMVGALRSPFFCLSDDAIFWLAARAPSDLARGLDLARSGALPELGPVDLQRARRAADLLDGWRAAKDRTTIGDLVDRVLDESGYEAALLAEPLGGRRRANARKVVRLARGFDEQGGFTLADFVAKLRADLRAAPKEEQAATTDEGGKSVRLMTIHKAKGLEFPIVIVPDLNRKAPHPKERIVFDADLGVIVKPEDDPAQADHDPTEGGSLGLLLHRNRERREEAAESLRLFYVATTRARDRLVLSAGLGPTEKVASTALKLLDERFDRQTGLCRAALPGDWGPPVVRVITTAPPPPGGPPPNRRPKPRLRALARVIATTPIELEDPPPPRWAGPRCVDLDPSTSLKPSAARVERLVRAILGDRQVFRPGGLRDAARRSGRRQDPASTAAVIDAAIRQLAPWVEHPIGRSIARADRVELAVHWSVAWPPESPEPTVFQGWLDVAFQGPDGGGTLVHFADGAVPEAHERLRLRLAARAAEDLGFGPVTRGWMISLGDGREPVAEVRFDADAVHEAIRAAGFGRSGSLAGG